MQPKPNTHVQPAGQPRPASEADRVATHRRQTALVRASLRRSVAYAPAAGRPEAQKG